MTPALVAFIISTLELVELWTGWSPGIDAAWIETLFMILNPLLVWLAGHWLTRGAGIWHGRGV